MPESALVPHRFVVHSSAQLTRELLRPAGPIAAPLPSSSVSCGVPAGLAGCDVALSSLLQEDRAARLRRAGLDCTHEPLALALTRRCCRQTWSAACVCARCSLLSAVGKRTRRWKWSDGEGRITMRREAADESSQKQTGAVVQSQHTRLEEHRRRDAHELLVSNRLDRICGSTFRQPVIPL
jgi:hypothetical protein